MSKNSRVVYSTATNGETVSHLSALVADLRPESPARIHRPRVAKHQPRLTDGIKHPVTVRKAV